MKIYKKFTTILLIFLLLILSDLLLKKKVNDDLKKYGSSIENQSKFRFEEIDNNLWGNRKYYLNPYLLYQYNEFGYKSDLGDFLLSPKKKNEIRIFLFGGSTMASSEANKEFVNISGFNNVSFKSSISYKLEEKLNLNKSNQDLIYNVIDASVFSQTSHQSFLHLKNAFKHKPDLVIFLDGFNDYRIDDEISNFLASDFHKHLPQNKNIFKLITYLSSKSAIFYILINEVYYNLISKKKNFIPKDDELNKIIDKNYKFINRSNKLNKENKEEIYNKYKTFNNNYLKISDYLSKKEINFLLIKQPYILHKNYEKLTKMEQAVYLKWLSFDTQEINFFNDLILSDYNEAETKKNIYFPFELISSSEDTFIDYCHFSENGINQFTDYIYRLIKKKFNNIQ